MKYGDKLREIKANIEAKNTARQKREAELKKRRIEQEISKLNSIFSNAWNEMLDSIATESQPNGIKVDGYGLPFRANGLRSPNEGPDNPAHPYHDVYLEWKKQAEDEGLILQIGWAHDGGGMSDWYTVTFTVEN